MKGVSLVAGSVVSVGLALLTPAAYRERQDPSRRRTVPGPGRFRPSERNAGGKMIHLGRRRASPTAAVIVALCFGMLSASVGPLLAEKPPPPDGTKIRATQVRKDGTSLVYGNGGAIPKPDAGPVKVTNTRTGQSTTTGATPQGMFGAVIPAKEGDTLLVSYDDSDSITVTVPKTETVIDKAVKVIRTIIEFWGIFKGLKKGAGRLKRTSLNQRSDTKLACEEVYDGSILADIASPLRVDLPPGVTLSGPAAISATGDLVLGVVSGNTHGSGQITVPIVSSGGDGIPDTLSVDLLPAGVDVAADAPLGTAFITLSDANRIIARYPLDVIVDGTPDPSLVTNPVTATLGPAGGSISDDLGDGVSIPVGALASTALVSYETVLPIPSPTTVPPGLSRMATARRFSPESLTSAAPMTITISYLDEEVADLGEPSLAVLVFDPDTSTWTPVPGSTLDMGANTMTFQTTHLGTFGVGGAARGPTEFYVDALTGNDANPGDYLHPWQHIDNGDYRGMLIPGDTVLVAPGTYRPRDCASGQLIRNCSGAAGNPITYRSYVPGQPVVVAGPVSPVDWTDNCFTVGNGVHRIVLDGFTMMDANYGVFATGVGDVGDVAKSIEVKNCTVRGLAGNSCGVCFDQGSCADWFIHNNVFDSLVGQGGICIAPSCTRATGVDVYNNTFHGCSSGCADRSLAGSTCSVTLRNNVLSHCSEAGILDRFAPASITHGYNLFFRNTKDYDYLASAGEHEFNADPMYSAPGEPFYDYTLQSASPAIDAGTYVGLPYNGSAPDLGAFESSFPNPPSMSWVTGRVTGDGTPLAGAQVAASGSPNAFKGPAASAITALDGRYALRVHDGTWYVAARKARYAPNPTPDTTVVVSGGDVANVDFALTYVGPTKLVELNADALPAGPLASCPNTGTVGGSFNTGAAGMPIVEQVAGKMAVTFAGAAADTFMVSSFTSPCGICGSDPWSGAFWVYNPTVEWGIEAVIGWGQRGNDAELCELGYGRDAAWSAGAHWGWFDIGFDRGTPTAAQWHHICVTFDGGEERVYTDGLLNSREEKFLRIFPDEPMYLGCYHNPDGWRSDYYSGSLASLEVYDYALTAAEVAEKAGVATIASVLTQPDETAITVTAPITLAPKDKTGTRTHYFYCEDMDRTAGIRIESAAPHEANVGGGARVTGQLNTNAAGERYILAAAPEILFPGGLPNVAPLGMNTKSVQADPLAVGKLVTVGATITQIAGDGSYFTIVDGYTQGGSEVETKVVIVGVSKIADFKVGDLVQVTGVVSKESPTVNVIIYRDIVTRYWKTGFEPDGGYTLGDIAGQNGWFIGWNPKSIVSPATISNEHVATGAQSLKLEVLENWAGEWWQNLFCLWSAQVMPDVPQRSATIRMKVWRDGGTTEYPTGSGTYKPNVWFNQVGWYPYETGYRYWDFGDDPNTLTNGDTTTVMHAQIYNERPRRYEDLGWPQIAGRFVDIVVFDDYVNHQRSVWYDGLPVADKVSVPDWADRFGPGIVLFYGSANPWGADPGIWGKPAYVDDVEVSWELL